MSNEAPGPSIASLANSLRGFGATQRHGGHGAEVVGDRQHIISQQLDADNDQAHQEFSEALSLAGVKYKRIEEMMAAEDGRQNYVKQGTAHLQEMNRPIEFKTEPVPNIDDEEVTATIPEIREEVEREKALFDSFDEEERNALREKGTLELAIRTLEKRNPVQIENKSADIQQDIRKHESARTAKQGALKRMQDGFTKDLDELRKKVTEEQKENDKKREEKVARLAVLNAEYQAKRQAIAAKAKDTLIIGMYKGSAETQQASSNLLVRLTNFSIGTSSRMSSGAAMLAAQINKLNAELKQLTKQTSATVSGLFAAAAMKDDQERAAQGELQRQKLEELQREEASKRQDIINARRTGVFRKLQRDYAVKRSLQVTATITIASMYLKQGHCLSEGHAKPTAMTGIFFILAIAQAVFDLVMFNWVFDEKQLHKPAGFRKNCWGFMQLRATTKLLIDFPLLIIQNYFIMTYGFSIPTEQVVFIFLSFSQMLYGFCFGDTLNVETMMHEKAALSPLCAHDIQKSQLREYSNTDSTVAGNLPPVTIMAQVISYRETDSHQWTHVDVGTAIGTRVKIIGLTSMPLLNGRDGVITRALQTARETDAETLRHRGGGFEVKLDGTNERRSLYTRNLMQRTTTAACSLDFHEGDEVTLQLHEKGAEVRAARDQCSRSFVWADISACTLKRIALTDQDARDLIEMPDGQEEDWVPMAEYNGTVYEQVSGAGEGGTSPFVPTRVKVYGLDNQVDMNDRYGVTTMPLHYFRPFPQSPPPPPPASSGGVNNSNAKPTGEYVSIDAFEVEIEKKEGEKDYGKVKLFRRNLLQVRTAAERLAQLEQALEIVVQKGDFVAVYQLGSAARVMSGGIGGGIDFSADGVHNPDYFDPMDFATQVPHVKRIIHSRKKLFDQEVKIINSARRRVLNTSAILAVPVGIFAAIALGSPGDCATGDFTGDWSGGEDKGYEGIGIAFGYLLVAMLSATLILGDREQEHLNIGMMCIFAVMARTSAKVLANSPLASLAAFLPDPRSCLPEWAFSYLDNAQQAANDAEEVMADQQIPTLTVMGNSKATEVIDRATLGAVWESLYGDKKSLSGEGGEGGEEEAKSEGGVSGPTVVNNANSEDVLQDV